MVSAQPKTVLIVDDQSTARGVLRRMLERAGYRVMEAESGERALALAAADAVDALVLDLKMPGIGGIETWIDALEYILLGASTIQVTTGIMHYGYRIVEDMIEGLSDFMTERGVKRISDLVGKALPNLHETEASDLERQGITQYDLDKCIGCGQCYIVCRDAAGQAIEWDAARRRPNLIEDKCLSCMLCKFVCPVAELISYREMPKGWKRRQTAVMDSSLEKEIKYEPFTKEGPDECVI